MGAKGAKTPNYVNQWVPKVPKLSETI